MIAYITLGADDILRAKLFYNAFLPALGYELEEVHGGLSYSIAAEPGQVIVPPDIYIKPAFDGRPASAGNGTMIAFQAHSQQQVQELHAAALGADGVNEGAP
ncbi:MAG: VOC family protein, partial [Pseudomonadota bacterium]